jgi:peptidylprolyl isomerase
VALAVTLAGCGGNDSSGSSSDSSSKSGGLGFDSMTVSGQVGTGATVKFSGKVTDSTQTTKVLEQGTGDTVNVGDSVILQTVIADGSTQKTVASSYQDHQPQVVSLSTQVQKVFLDALSGKTIGSRVAIFAPATAFFGASGNPSLGVSQNDPVLIVFDLVGKPLDKPNGKQHTPPSWSPKIEKSKGVVTGLDFAKTPKPTGALRSAALYDGTGPVVKKGETVFARYLGEVYGGTSPFDQNFDGSSPPLGVQLKTGPGGVIAGWVKGLAGQHVGSEVMLAIPPKDGYGKKGSPSAGIKGTDTLYFVVDIVGAA